MILSGMFARSAVTRCTNELSLGWAVPLLPYSGVFVVEVDAVEAVLGHGVRELLRGRRSRLLGREVGESGALVVAQHRQDDLDALLLQRPYLRGGVVEDALHVLVAKCRYAVLEAVS